MITQNKRLIGLLLSPLLLLLVPLIAMQYTTEVNWTVGDFLVAGVLLLGIGLAIELLLRRISQQPHLGLSHPSQYRNLPACLGRVGGRNLWDAFRRFVAYF